MKISHKTSSSIIRRREKRSRATWRAFEAGLLVLLCLGQITGFLLATERFACAYADPGSGFLVLQIVGASVTGWCYLARRKLRSFFRDSTHKTMSGQDGIDNPSRDSNGAPKSSDNDSNQ